MNIKKIDEIGEKLNVNSSKIEPRKTPNWFKKHSFWIANATTSILSILVGITFGLIETSDYISNYPYTYPNKFGPHSFYGVASINIVNGIYTIPKRKYFNLNQIARIGIYIINLIISFAIYWISYQSLGSYSNAIAYNVYKSPTQIIFQNKEVTRKYEN